VVTWLSPKQYAAQTCTVTQATRIDGCSAVNPQWARCDALTAACGQHPWDNSPVAMKTERPTYQDRITQDPAVMVGKPVVRGTRIPVELVLEQLSYNLDLDELFAAYPRLTIEDVKACLAYAHAAVEAKRKRAARKETVSTAQA
jgi:uncharacterized protein (DUF433 family)